VTYQHDEPQEVAERLRRRRAGVQSAALEERACRFRLEHELAQLHAIGGEAAPYRKGLVVRDHLGGGGGERAAGVRREERTFGYGSVSVQRMRRAHVCVATNDLTASLGTRALWFPRQKTWYTVGGPASSSSADAFLRFNFSGTTAAASGRTARR
jgi:hypothetical protein